MAGGPEPGNKVKCVYPAAEGKAVRLMVIYQKKKSSSAVMPLVCYCTVVVQEPQRVPGEWHPFTHRCTQSEWDLVCRSSSVKSKWFHLHNPLHALCLYSFLFLFILPFGCQYCFTVQETPARVFLCLIEQLHFTEDDSHAKHSEFNSEYVFLFLHS